jgi:Predicted membrane protein
MDTIDVGYPDDTSEKSRGVALALATVLGVFGGHRFYVGKTGTGILMAATWAAPAVVAVRHDPDRQRLVP